MLRQPVLKTPHLDALAAQGTRFTHAFATTASCSASRSVILTGLHNHFNGLYGHTHGYHKFESFRSMAAVSLPPQMAETCKPVFESRAASGKPFFLYFCTSDPHRGGGRDQTFEGEHKPDLFASDLWAAATWQAQYQKGPSAKYGSRTVDSYINRPQFELFNIAKDPNETKNLADDPEHAAILQTYKDKLKAVQKKTGDPWIMKWRYE